MNRVINSNQVKLATEIGMLASDLNPTYQAYVLNTIQTLLFSQSVEEEIKEEVKNAQECTM